LPRKAAARRMLAVFAGAGLDETRARATFAAHNGGTKMTVKTLLAAAALMAAPVLAHAECGHSKQVMTCAAGSEYSEDSKTCVPISS
jgi:hypothetical protein